MELRKYGSILRRVTHDDIETIRQWRNHPKVAENMRFRGHITPEMQEKWFESVNNDNNYFFIMLTDAGDKIGMVEVKRIDYQKGEGDVGMFVFHEDKAHPTTPYQVYFSLLDFVFDTLKLAAVKATILPGNARATRFSVSCGFKMEEHQPDAGIQAWRLQKDDYQVATRKLKELLSRGSR